MEILQLLETLQADEASISRLFGRDLGTGMHQASSGKAYMQRLVEATSFLADVIEGKRPMYHLQEAMTTSDFPLLFGDVLDRQVLAKYREWAGIWPMYCKRSTVPDFRLVSRFAVSGAESVLDEVEQQAEYPAASLDEARYQYLVKKYGRRLPFAWETMINDDLQSLQDAPERFGRASRRSEEKFATELHVDADGPLSSVYSAGNGNVITANPVLDIAGLQVGFTVISGQVDDEGEPIIIEMITLEVPPALEITARNILNAIHIEVQTSGGGSSAQALRAENWMRTRVQLIVNPYLPIVAFTSNTDTQWYLHAAPGNGRPAFEMGFLRGHTEPEIFVKEPNARRVGGGAINPMDGNFDTDSIEYKIRHVFGGSVIDPKMTAASDGSGS